MPSSTHKLHDIIGTLYQSATGDTGALVANWGTSPSATLNFDEITIDDTHPTTNNAGGQDATALNRLGQGDWTITIKTKYGPGFFQPKKGKQTRLVLSNNTVAAGICPDCKITINDDSTLEMTIKAYGAPIEYGP